jgi:Putative abortive phage resistance protein AbiGi, antitoxin
MQKQGRPDFSDYVGHFTKSAAPSAHNGKSADSVKGIKGTAQQKLISILKSRKILATPMPWTNKPAVAFTECTWGSLVAHTKEYSPYGIGFEKSLLFHSGGGPAIYLRSDLHESQMDYASTSHPAWKGFTPDLYAFITPFNPSYASAADKLKFKLKKTVDYTHEREWRVPHDFQFDLSAIKFVVLPNYESMAAFPKDLKDGIGRDKFILADVYSNIEKLWPVHIQ